MVGGKQHWAYQIANRLAQNAKGKVINCASGISPSGPIHIGNLREVMTTELVYRALVNQGSESNFVLSWDDFDRLRKVPAGLPEKLKEDIGKPYSKIADPYGEFDSYASRFISIFQESLRELNIMPRFIRQSQEYASGRYDQQIQFVLEKRKEIGRILARNMTQGMSEEEIKNYFPISVYSRFTNKDNTKVISSRDTEIKYKCLDTNKIDLVDFTKEHIVKLPWKIDWPMRWKLEEITFEPGGPDHASPGSSYDVSSQIAKEIFGISPPDFQAYSFIRIKGQGGKMSSSTGNIISPEELLKIYSSEMVRWLYARFSPNTQLDIALDKDVIRVYAEFDKSLEEDRTELSKLVSPDKELNTNPVPFRKIFGLGESTAYNLRLIERILKEEGETYDLDSITDRLTKSDYWSKIYYPEGRSRLLSQQNQEHYNSLNEEEKNEVQELLVALSGTRRLDREYLEQLVYSIPKKEGMAESDKRKSQRRFFKNVYNLLFGRNQGPRLPTYFWASDIEQIANLLDFSELRT